VEVVLRLGYHHPYPQPLQQQGGQDAALKVTTDRHNPYVEVAHPHLPEGVLVGSVQLSSLRGEVRNLLHLLDVPIQGKHLVSQVGQGSGQAAAESTQADDHNLLLSHLYTPILS